MKVIIAGSRNFNDYAITKKYCDHYLQNSKNIEIVSGGAKGADKCGEMYAFEKGLKLKLFPADWEKHGKSAGPIRNQEMAEYADALIAFWDGESRGTKHMISTAEKLGLIVRIVRYEKGN